MKFLFLKSLLDLMNKKINKIFTLVWIESELPIPFILNRKYSKNIFSHFPKIIIKRFNGHIYYLHKQYKNQNKRYLCKKPRCHGSIKLNPEGTVVKQVYHRCDINQKIARAIKNKYKSSITITKTRIPEELQPVNKLQSKINVSIYPFTNFIWRYLILYWIDWKVCLQRNKTFSHVE